MKRVDELGESTKGRGWWVFTSRIDVECPLPAAGVGGRLLLAVAADFAL